MNIVHQALIVAHGQPSDPVPAEAALAGFAARVQAGIPDISVTSATLAAPGRLEEAAGKLTSEAVIYPLFMAKGWFVTSALPDRLSDRNVRILDPLGVDPQLPRLAADSLLRVAVQRGWNLDETSILLAAHGSGRSRNPAKVAQIFASRLQTRLGAKEVRVGFVEEVPHIATMARDMSRQSICLPFFARSGGHSREDIPAALDEAEFAGIRLPVLGELPEMPPHVSNTLKQEFALST